MAMTARAVVLCAALVLAAMLAAAGESSGEPMSTIFANEDGSSTRTITPPKETKPPIFGPDHVKIYAHQGDDGYVVPTNADDKTQPAIFGDMATPTPVPTAPQTTPQLPRTTPRPRRLRSRRREPRPFNHRLPRMRAPVCLECATACEKECRLKTAKDSNTGRMATMILSACLRECAHRDKPGARSRRRRRRRTRRRPPPRRPKLSCASRCWINEGSGLPEADNVAADAEQSGWVTDRDIETMASDSDGDDAINDNDNDNDNEEDDMYAMRTHPPRLSPEAATRTRLGRCLAACPAPRRSSVMGSCEESCRAQHTSQRSTVADSDTDGEGSVVEAFELGRCLIDCGPPPPPPAPTPFPVQQQQHRHKRRKPGLSATARRRASRRGRVRGGGRVRTMDGRRYSLRRGGDYVLLRVPGEVEVQVRMGPPEPSAGAPMAMGVAVKTAGTPSALQFYADENILLEGRTGSSTPLDGWDGGHYEGADVRVSRSGEITVMTSSVIVTLTKTTLGHHSGAGAWAVDVVVPPRLRGEVAGLLGNYDRLAGDSGVEASVDRLRVPAGESLFERRLPARYTRFRALRQGDAEPGPAARAACRAALGTSEGPEYADCVRDYAALGRDMPGVDKAARDMALHDDGAFNEATLDMRGQ